MFSGSANTSFSTVPASAVMSTDNDTDATETEGQPQNATGRNLFNKVKVRNVSKLPIILSTIWNWSGAACLQLRSDLEEYQPNHLNHTVL